MWKPFKRRARSQPSIPEGVRIYAVGDVHGRADLLRDVSSRIDRDAVRRPTSRPICVFIGDYIDRGPASREVIDLLLMGSRACETVLLKGNHEAYMADFLKNPGVLENWRLFGGLETLMSYGLALPLNPDVHQQVEIAAAFDRVLPFSHRQWLERLQVSFSCGDYFFVHAGVRPGIPLMQQREEDLLWIREDFLLCENDFSKIIVHGHTPVPEPDFRSNRINIDTGAYATGRLTCVMFEREERHLI